MAAPANSTATDNYRAPTAQNRGADQPHLAVVFHSDLPLAACSRHRLDVDEVRIGRGSAPATRTQDGARRVLALSLRDRWMSSGHARLLAVEGQWLLEDLGSKNGSVVNGMEVDRVELNDGDLIELGRTFFLFRVTAAGEGDEDATSGDPNGEFPPTLKPSLEAELRKLGAVVRSSVPVMLLGETGTGKELLARGVHLLSRRPGALVAVNCAALPAHLVESELFGYRKGAFSGADEDRQGLVRSADRGTLFLDEIGELAPPAQASLLRTLQESEVLPLGATRPVKVDLRVISATHQDLQRMIADDRFRPDLLARLSGFNLRVPPLRERREDVGLIIAALLRRLFPDKADTVRFTPGAARALLRHSWPLNIRELQKCLETSVVLAGQDPVDVRHLPAMLREPATATAPPAPLTPEDQRRADEVRTLLREHRGNITAAAQAMGKARMQMQRWIKRYRIDVQEFKR